MSRVNTYFFLIFSKTTVEISTITITITELIVRMLTPPICVVSIVVGVVIVRDSEVLVGVLVVYVEGYVVGEVCVVGVIGVVIVV